MLGTKRALNKAIRRLDISRLLTSWQWGFFVKEPHSAKDDNNNIPGPQPPKKVLSDIPRIFPCLGKSKKGEMYVFCSTCECDFSFARTAGMTRLIQIPPQSFKGIIIILLVKSMLRVQQHKTHFKIPFLHYVFIFRNLT